MVNRDIRKFTSEMTDNATYSNYFMIFESFTERSALDANGDAVDTAAGMGEMMLALSNGRDAEREADASALEYLAAAGLRQDGLSRFFTRMQKEKKNDSRGSLFSTHPELAERMKVTERTTEGKSALIPEQWKALRAICADSVKPTR